MAQVHDRKRKQGGPYNYTNKERFPPYVKGRGSDSLNWREEGGVASVEHHQGGSPMYQHHQHYHHGNHGNHHHHHHHHNTGYYNYYEDHIEMASFLFARWREADNQRKAKTGPNRHLP